ncbi:MAG: bifunctional (p)ppGpp synthetase/guanosine-3',5'-bis(diphosphate) 3'-pyrophosphohydrolase [Thiomonas arsenitoxydans]|uniref:Bifunctional (P)ppGpp synthetase/guanosine-3',5'-bis(Diphosphate) 3'-pyrophosphohydrolase n=1 Tax=Thiomonas arsenitoxydans (strain DSM 22701 / CIP 110005 / 3As) TaxID=426114 RepID=A0A8I1MVC4_THIA3|nr:MULTISPECIES: bifunctional (p)ppGpp synthetase/guanosine-3',5'-bis(diphosphate) 3'-pyrophosphohydrolase [Thiomonas]MBN8744450.1 bifunctional (p)ppGpp synthetase/guanosine-3',5'-bis(diphosphate) 3'-pyrophosphohydrolase [Thiomonas arsenitoxydans]ODU95937.1 MAG: guanosine-3',5'-bis(diphosphate) 3'-pyrophosphohydrolase [Thiomonas sp. SCN 64-16]
MPSSHTATPDPKASVTDLAVPAADQVATIKRPRARSKNATAEPEPAAIATGDEPAATRHVCVSLASLLDKLQAYLPEADLQRIREAYRFADAAHLGQYRASGEPYISHPVAVAELCADWKLDTQAIMAALLHDTAEDKGITQAELIEHFGSTVADLVDGLTKLDKLQFSNREENQSESFRKMLLAMARDIRVILVKLADRLHNMRTLGAMAASKRVRISRETMDIYAPIAHRLGLNLVYRELQDLGFANSHPNRYAVLSRAVLAARGNRHGLVEKILAAAQAALNEAQVPSQLFGREKTLYSIYRKMRSKHLSFAHIQDIFGFRVLVPDVLDCYRALGVLHSLYKPMPGKFEDYIAIPKANGYQSLHTTLIGPNGNPVEFQIRTEAMHRIAESGVAAHWLYKTPEDKPTPQQAQTNAWLQSLLDIQTENRDWADFLETVKVDLAPDAVYVFTPKSRILALPRGATPVDFAYAIHTNLGDQTVAAKVNNALVPLRTELRSGDVVEIITAPASRPNPSWLSFVRTGRARSKIRHALRTTQQAESVELGRRLLQSALRHEHLDLLTLDDAVWDKLLRWTGFKSRDDLYADIGLGKRVADILAKRVVALVSPQDALSAPLLDTIERLESRATHDAQTSLQLDGSEGISVRYATCCRPIPGDAIIGYLGKGEGLIVHQQDCDIARRLFQKDPDRWIDLSWAEECTRPFETGLSVIVQNTKGVLARVAAAISEHDSDIAHVTMDEDTQQATTELRFVVQVRDRKHLADVLRALRRLQFVVRASRAKNRTAGLGSGNS